MAGVCRKCGRGTTNTRERSKSGQCFGCEYGVKPVPKLLFSESENMSLEDRVERLERLVARLRFPARTRVK